MMLLNIFIACICGIAVIMIFILFIILMTKEDGLERLKRRIEREIEWEKEQAKKPKKKTGKVDDEEDDSEDMIAVEAIACKQFT